MRNEGKTRQFIDAPLVIKYLRGDLIGDQGSGSSGLRGDQGESESDRVKLKLLTVEGADHGGWYE